LDIVNPLGRMFFLNNLISIQLGLSYNLIRVSQCVKADCPLEFGSRALDIG